MVVQGVVRGNTVLLDNHESLELFDGCHVLLTLISKSDAADIDERVSSNRLDYLKRLRLREKRPSDRSAGEIDQYIQECREHDRF